MKKPKSLGKQCDILWAKKVKDRAGWKCEYCGKDGPVAAHHIIPRTCHPLRHDMENGVSLCHPRHHLYWAHKDALGFAEWIETIRDIEYLNIARHRQSKNDYMAIKLYLEGL